MVVYVKSRMEMLSIKGTHPEKIPDYNIISIRGYASDSKPIFKEDTDSILSLVFDDLTQRDLDVFFPTAEKGSYRLFNKRMAKKVISFTNNMDHTKPLIVHCQAGVSRSAAVAVWVQYFYGTLEDVQDLFLRYDYINPNELVLSTLMSVSKIEYKRNMNYEKYDYDLAKIKYPSRENNGLEEFKNVGGILIPKKLKLKKK